MALDPVKIPANVQVEEKIFGPISLRQIMILMICGGLSYAIWSTAGRINGAPLGVFQSGLCWLPLVIGAAFAFIKINDVSLFRILLLNIEGFDKPSIRRFGPRTGINIVIRFDTNEPKKEMTVKDAMDEQKLSNLSTSLDKGPAGEVPANAVRILPELEESEADVVPEWHIEEPATQPKQEPEQAQTFHDLLPPNHA